jgi:hypothetical protein
VKKVAQNFEKIAQNVAHPIFCQNKCKTLPRKQVAQNLSNFKKTTQSKQ